jgi:hypothetical protein
MPKQPEGHAVKRQLSIVTTKINSEKLMTHKVGILVENKKKGAD